MIAAKNGRTDIADILLSGNCDVDIQETVSSVLMGPKQVFMYSLCFILYQQQSRSERNYIIMNLWDIHRNT